MCGRRKERTSQRESACRRASVLEIERRRNRDRQGARASKQDKVGRLWRSSAVCQLNDICEHPAGSVVAPRARAWRQETKDPIREFMSSGTYTERVTVSNHNRADLGESTYIYTYIHIYTHTHTHTHIYIYIYIYTYMLYMYLAPPTASGQSISCGTREGSLCPSTVPRATSPAPA